jgi:hypothetical protein
MILLYCNWLSTWWQWSVSWYKNRKETAIYKKRNNTRNSTKTQNTQNRKLSFKKENKLKKGSQNA